MGSVKPLKWLLISCSAVLDKTRIHPGSGTSGPAFTLGADYLDALRPITAALEFIKTKDTDILEKLHKETRELVIDIVTQIDPKTNIPKEVHDSVKN